MDLCAVTICVVVIVARTRHVPRVPVKELNLRDAVVFSDGSRDADGTTGWESSNRCSVLLPDDRREHLMGVRLVQVDESGSTPAIGGGAFARDLSAYSTSLAYMVGCLGCRYRLTEADCD